MPERRAVAALEDKIVQRATATLLNAIYEEDFLGFSYGFRPGRGAHDALDALVVGIDSRRVNFILDADIQSFFDEVSQAVAPGFPFDEELAATRLAADEGEAQEVEGLRLAEPAPLAVRRREAAELDQAGLVRMKRQRKLL